MSQRVLRKAGHLVCNTQSNGKFLLLLVPFQRRVILFVLKIPVVLL